MRRWLARALPPGAREKEVGVRKGDLLAMIDAPELDHQVSRHEPW
jgi:hypothetical protein